MDPHLESYSIAKRKCRFAHEIEGLRLFKVYTQNNCVFECKMERARAACGCVPWYIDLDNATETCDLFGNKCFEFMTLRANDHLDFRKSVLFSQWKIVKDPRPPPTRCQKCENSGKVIGALRNPLNP